MPDSIAFLNAHAAAARVGLAVPTIYARRAAGTFPLPYKINGRTLWRSDELDAWRAVTPRSNNGPSAAVRAELPLSGSIGPDGTLIVNIATPRIP